MVSIMTPVSTAPSYLELILGTQPFICVQKNAPNSFRIRCKSTAFLANKMYTLLQFRIALFLIFGQYLM